MLYVHTLIDLSDFLESLDVDEYEVLIDNYEGYSINYICISDSDHKVTLTDDLESFLNAHNLFIADDILKNKIRIYNSHFSPLLNYK